jgi:hypothetical protein
VYRAPHLNPLAARRNRARRPIRPLLRVLAERRDEGEVCHGLTPLTYREVRAPANSRTSRDLGPVPGRARKLLMGKGISRTLASLPFPFAPVAQRGGDHER